MKIVEQNQLKRFCYWAMLQCHSSIAQ